MKLECQHRARAEGETFVRCLTCLSWRFTVGVRWWPQHFELPWAADEVESASEVYQVFGVQLQHVGPLLADL